MMKRCSKLSKIFVLNYPNHEINVFAVLVVISQILKIANYFVFCENVVLENKTNEQIQYL